MLLWLASCSTARRSIRTKTCSDGRWYTVLHWLLDANGVVWHRRRDVHWPSHWRIGRRSSPLVIEATILISIIGCRLGQRSCAVVCRRARTSFDTWSACWHLRNFCSSRNMLRVLDMLWSQQEHARQFFTGTTIFKRPPRIRVNVYLVDYSFCTTTDSRWTPDNRNDLRPRIAQVSSLDVFACCRILTWSK